MIRAAYAPIRNPRHQALSIDVLVPGFDMSGQAPSFQIRENPESPAALVSLYRADAPGLAGVFLDVTFDEQGIPTTQILVTVTRAIIEGLPQARPIGSDLRAFYGLKMDGLELFGGPITLEAQANHG